VLRNRPAMWALIAFCVPLVAWLVASFTGPKVDLSPGDPSLGYLFQYFDWTVWLRESLFEILVIVLLALIAIRLWTRP
jgi:hypothetical protein